MRLVGTAGLVDWSASDDPQFLVTVRPGALVWLVRAGQWLQAARYPAWRPYRERGDSSR
jgi:hypothetical protein